MAFRQELQGLLLGELEFPRTQQMKDGIPWTNIGVLNNGVPWTNIGLPSIHNGVLMDNDK